MPRSSPFCTIAGSTTRYERIPRKVVYLNNEYLKTNHAPHQTVKAQES
ncbi:hypothetical protein IU483_30285 [Streptomyces gardneri]|nr:hypothetical protein [Streptomyces gardneri]